MIRKALIVLCLLLLFPSNSITYAYEQPQYRLEEKTNPFAERTVWKYKIINGHLYKRLYNTTKQKWETDWILVK